MSLDLYDIFAAFEVDYVLGHALKKLTCPGSRSGGKSRLHDPKDAKWTLERAIGLEEARLLDLAGDDGPQGGSEHD